MIDIEKFYRIANKLVGDLGKDLVHHVFEKTHDRIPEKNPDGFFYRVMLNELRSDSKFRKQYDRVQAVDYLEQDCGIDPQHEHVQRILSQLTREGYRLEVKVFIELAEGTSAVQLNKLTGVRYENLLNIRNFVKSEVIKRYADFD